MGRWDRRRWFWAWVRLKDLAQEGTERKDEDAESLAGEAMVGGTAGAENFVISANLWRRKRYRWIRERFPPNLLRIVGNLGIWLEFTLVCLQ
jgi:hypothetical protein